MPWRETQRAAARIAASIARSRGAPAARAAHSAPQKLSPSTPESIAATGSAWRVPRSPPERQRAPSAPSVTMAARAPAPTRNSRAASGSAVPAKAAASTQFSTGHVTERPEAGGVRARTGADPAERGCGGARGSKNRVGSFEGEIALHDQPVTRHSTCRGRHGRLWREQVGRERGRDDGVLPVRRDIDQRKVCRCGDAQQGRARSPSAAKAAAAQSPSASRPSGAVNRVSAEKRRATTAWFTPLPPSSRLRPLAISVSPGAGKRSTSRMRSSCSCRHVNGHSACRMADRPGSASISAPRQGGPGRLRR